jgi:hypothetical protein
MIERIEHFNGGGLLGNFWRRLMGLWRHRWPEGKPLMSGEVRWGTRLEGGTIIGAPGVVFTPLPICSRCQQTIDTEAEQNDTAKAYRRAEDARFPRIFRGFEAGTNAGQQRVVNPLANTEQQKG